MQKQQPQRPPSDRGKDKHSKQSCYPPWSAPLHCLPVAAAVTATVKSLQSAQELSSFIQAQKKPHNQNQRSAPDYCSVFISRVGVTVLAVTSVSPE